MTNKAMTLETISRALADQLLDPGAEGIPIRLVASEDDPVLKELTEVERGWIKAQGWKPKDGAVLLLPGSPGGVGGVLLGTGGKDWASRTPLLTGVLPSALRHSGGCSALRGAHESRSAVSVPGNSRAKTM